VAAPHQNSLVDRILPEAGIFNPALTGKGRWEWILTDSFPAASNNFDQFDQ
jgi:hypothetical protein